MAVAMTAAGMPAAVSTAEHFSAAVDSKQTAGHTALIIVIILASGILTAMVVSVVMAEYGWHRSAGQKE